MQATEIVKTVKTFLDMVADAQSNFENAKENENQNNLKTQDILHYCELQPTSAVDFANELIHLISEVRQERRIAKKELEISDKFNNWCIKNKIAVEELRKVLGSMRKILNDQSERMYMVKTNIMPFADQTAIVEEPKGIYQFTIFDFLE